MSNSNSSSGSERDSDSNSRSSSSYSCGNLTCGESVAFDSLSNEDGVHLVYIVWDDD